MQPMILVVEDEPDILEFVTLVLESEGYTVVGFTEGRPAQEFVARHTPDLGLVDLLMPGMDGDEFILYVRSLPHGTFPIVIMSASTDKARIRAAPIQDYIAKPFDLDDLLARIQRLVHPTRSWLESTLQGSMETE